MEYIKSKELSLLIRDTFKLIDRKLMDHGSKTAYLFCKMLEQTGRYEMYEIADFSILATLHDIGAYKTDDLDNVLQFEHKSYMPHSVYGYLFLKYLSPLEEQSKMLLYHHIDYDKVASLRYPYKEEMSYLNLAEKVILYKDTLGDQYDVTMFDKYAGRKFSQEALDLYHRVVEDCDLFEKLQTEEYQQELDEILDYVLFNDEEKKKYLEMLMYCTGFRSESFVVDTVTSICICDEVGKYMGCSKDELELLYYGALIHDIGMLTIPREVIEANRRLTEPEMEQMRRHVEIEEKILQNRLHPLVVEIATAHHERGDGSGYPKKLRDSQMTRLQGILQLADTVTGLSSVRSYHDALPKEKVIAILREEAVNRRYKRDIVDILVTYYDEIMDVVKREAGEILAMHNKLKEQYSQVYGNLQA